LRIERGQQKHVEKTAAIESGDLAQHPPGGRFLAFAGLKLLNSRKRFHRAADDLAAYGAVILHLLLFDSIAANHDHSGVGQPGSGGAEIENLIRLLTPE
jgi:hypothetical protein